MNQKKPDSIDQHATDASPFPSTDVKSSESISSPIPPSDSVDPAPRFSPEEEASLLQESHTQKAHANTLYASHSYSQAISEYDKALASCPTYLEYEIAVLKSNIAACHLQLSEWQAAIDAATAALDALDRLNPPPPPPAPSSSNPPPPTADAQSQPPAAATPAKVVELSTSDDTPAATAAALASLNLTDAQYAAHTKLRTKVLLRRARARTSLPNPTWASLQSAEDDYTTLSRPPLSAGLSRADRTTVQEALRVLPVRVKESREREVGEMMGKLREVGDGLLKPFGLSTDMFKVNKGEGDGAGYSVSFGS